MEIFESVPNVSCDSPHQVDRLITAVRGAGVVVADAHSDHDHGRTVLTMLGRRQELTDALVALVREASEFIDLREHKGVHPRMGAVDVIPIIPMGDTTVAAAQEVAHQLGCSLWAAGFPAIRYGLGARFGRTSGPRRVGSLAALIDLPRSELFGSSPSDVTPDQLEKQGVTLVGVRPVLVACNIWFRPDTSQSITALLARLTRLAGLVRESGGGPAGVRALAFHLPRAGVVQLSLNIEQPETCSPSLLMSRVEYAQRLVSKTNMLPSAARFELVGLAPRRWLGDLRYVCSELELDLYAAEYPIEYWVEEFTRMRAADM